MTNKHIRKLREQLPDKIPLECHHCHYEWEYRGENPFYAQCPKCKFQVNVSKNRTDIETQEGQDKKKPKLLDELKNMPSGSAMELERDKGPNIFIEKNFRISGKKDERLVEGVDQFLISKQRQVPTLGDKKRKVTSGRMVLLEEELEEINKKAKKEGEKLEDKLIELVRLKDNNISQFKKMLNSLIGQSSKRLEEYGGA